jgi:hypothetical protein
MHEASTLLFELARSIAIPYAELGAEAVMVTGSVALGLADFYSDLDMTAYYREIPSDEDLRAARERNRGPERIWSIGDPADGGFVEAYRVDGVEVQIGHITIATWERDIESVLAAEDVTTPLQKALSGTLICKALHGAELIDRWKARIGDYPDELARRMVRHHLRFFPLWGMDAWFVGRDADIWRRQMLVEGAQNILGILAGINRSYFTTFQFKHLRYFISTMRIVPHDLAGRIETIVGPDMTLAGAELERLVEDVLGIVDREMPEIDTAAARRRIGWRSRPWREVETMTE